MCVVVFFATVPFVALIPHGQCIPKLKEGVLSTVELCEQKLYCIYSKNRTNFVMLYVRVTALIPYSECQCHFL